MFTSVVWTFDLMELKSIVNYSICDLDKPCVKNECNLFHVHNWIQFFVSMYNDTIFELYY
jgi:hypothetical protein